MSDERLCWLPATTLSEMYRRKEASPVEVVDAVLDRLERVNPGINAFVTVLADQAREAARRAQEQLAQGTDDLPPLHGIPVTVKDLTNTAGVRTNLRQRRLRRSHAGRGLGRLGADEGGRGDPDRQDHHAGVRHARGH